MDEQPKWEWQMGFIVFFGLVIYASVVPLWGLLAAALIHMAVSAIYIYLVVIFGHDSKIEMGVVLSISVILFSILAPVWQRAKEHRNSAVQKRALAQKKALEQRKMPINPTPEFLKNKGTR